MIVATIIRDGADYLPRLREQIEALAPRAVVIVEGDSTDETWKELAQWADSSPIEIHPLKVEHGGRKYPSIDYPFRWRQIALACNVALTAAVRMLQADETLLYVESDLIWEADDLRRLAAHIPMFDAVSPMSMQRGQFYDTWGYRKDGMKFGQHYPYFPTFTHDAMHQIDSSGSCFVLSHAAAQVVHFDHDDCILGIGRDLTKRGFTLWLDPTVEVRHP